MPLQDLSDNEILDIAQPILDNIVLSANASDYEQFSRDFHPKFAEYVNAEEFARQQRENLPQTGPVSTEHEFIRILRTHNGVMILWVSAFEKLPGEVLTGLSLREFDDEVKVVGVWHNC